jgi:outer membrane protein TolC
MPRRLSLLALAPLSFHTAQAATYTLPELVAHVSHEEPAVVAARAQVQVRRAQVLEQELRWLPDGEARLSLSGSPAVRCIDNDFAPLIDPSSQARASHCVRSNVVDLLRSQPGTSLEDRAPFAAPLTTIAVGLRQPLFTSGKITAAIKAARSGVEMDDARALGTARDLALEAVRLFGELKAAREAQVTIELARDSIRDWLAHVERELDGKNRERYTESDRLRLRVQLENVELAHLAEVRRERASLEALRALTGDAEAEVDSSELVWQETQASELAEWQRAMRSERPEVRASQSGLRAYGFLRRVQAGFALPDLALGSGLSWGSAPGVEVPTLGFANLPPSQLFGAFSLAVRQPLDIGARTMRYRQTRLEAESEAERFRLGIGYWSLEVDKAWLDFVEAKKRLDDARWGERVSQGWYAVVSENVAIGAATDGRELVEVVLAWMAFRLKRVDALKDSLLALASLRRVSGRPILGGGALP